MMKLRYAHLEGRQFVHGSADCYGLCRDFYRDNLGLELTNYARPDFWWDSGLNLYMDNFEAEGFEVLHGPSRDWQVCDAFLIARGAKSGVATHAAVYIGGDKILHHYHGRLSNVEPFVGVWRNKMVAALRHKSMRDYRPDLGMTTYDLAKDPRIAWRLQHGNS